MTPKHEHHRPDDKPDCRFESSAFAKKEEQKWTGEKDRTAKRKEPDVREMRIISEAFEQTFLHVPGDGMDREESALVPRLSHQVRDVCITEIENRMKTREVICCGQQTESYGDNQKPNKFR